MALMTPQEAADFLSVSTKHLRRLTDEGAIRYVNIGTGLRRETRRYTAEDLREFIEGRSKLVGPATKIALKPATRSPNIVGIDFRALSAAMTKPDKKK